MMPAGKRSGSTLPVMWIKKKVKCKDKDNVMKIVSLDIFFLIQDFPAYLCWIKNKRRYLSLFILTNFSDECPISIAVLEKSPERSFLFLYLCLSLIPIFSLVEL